MELDNNLLADITFIQRLAIEREYFINAKDVFALGFMCGKYGLKRLVNNQAEVMEICKQYDKTDELGMLDTIAETLVDLGITHYE